MDFKEEYRNLVKFIKEKAKEKNQSLLNEDIAKRLGYDRSYFSSLMGNTAPVKDFHIKDLKSEFKEELENTTYETLGAEYEINDPHAPLATDNYKDKYYKQLEKHNQLLTEQLRQSQEVIKKINKDLEVVLKNQLTIAAMIEGAKEVVLRRLSNTENEYQILITTNSKIVNLKRTELEAVGNLIDVHS